ncbi:acyl transferase domain-containing protein [Rhodococcus sp. SMB37]|uniref:acyltransferase domain-containing protein n=1 Tax=Rhodococcus sp. SMB37 TaxID=2512213 RepID=UPI0010D877B0|nr:type I polyketide synthase [Rhodococcus sp. SMB37]TCN45142.1 acyl transferase domain-containing protein [Rhodococcus sp. SMB37]
MLLKRYADALEDGDTIHAVIKGSAVNNDGADKVGFTAPSPRGQAAVIAEALAVGEVDPSTISYVETHGTATRVGDSIEVEALEEALSGAAPGSCLLGALKPVIGHTDTAAGASALIKVLLALKHETLPPVPDFREADPAIDFESSVCRVNAGATAWPRTPGSPRRAGISAFSIGGTNAHVVVEEPPVAPAGRRKATPGPLVLPLSAATPAALNTLTNRLADAFDGTDLDPADAATTLSLGRVELGFRRHVIVEPRAHAAEALRASSTKAAVHAAGGEDVVFVFPGQGSQFPGMGSDLYRDVPAYAAAVDRCAERFAPLIGIDLRQFLTVETTDDNDDLTRQLARTDLTQPALFTVEYATVMALQDLGIIPTVLLGHSIGEFAAAVASGIFELGDAITAVAARGSLMASTAAGATAVVRCTEDDVRSALTGTGACVAAVNGPRQVVVSGTTNDIATVVERLREDNRSVTLLPTDRAFHSPLVDEVVRPFDDVIRALGLRTPRIPMICTSTATMLDAATATDTGTWSTQLRTTVRFADSVAVVDRTHPDAVWVEVGPGTALGSLVRSCGVDTDVVATVGRPESAWPAGTAGADLAGRLWCAGAQPDHTSFAGSGRRVPLPTYPFERQRHRIGRSNHMPTASATDPVALTRAERPETGTEFVAPRSGLEDAVAETVAEALGLERLGAHDDLFAFGGDSVTATAVAARLSEAYPVTVTLADVMASPATPSGIAERLTSLLTDAVENMSEEEVAQMLSVLADPA